MTNKTAQRANSILASPQDKMAVLKPGKVDPMHVEPDPKSAREHLRATKSIMIRWAAIGFVVVFWIYVAQHWPWISATVRGWL